LILGPEMGRGIDQELRDYSARRFRIRFLAVALVFRFVELAGVTGFDLRVLVRRAFAMSCCGKSK
jgi:hypothetical protein